MTTLDWSWRFGEWIFCKDELPPLDFKVLVYYPHSNVFDFAQLKQRGNELYWWFNPQQEINIKDSSITAWMLLPYPPREECE